MEWNFAPPPKSDITDRAVLQGSDRLQNKKIALLVTGSIAALKAPLIARSLRRQGADVVAFASAEALRYTTIDALAWSTNNPVVTKLTAAAEHLSDDSPFAAYVVAPATYNTINKLRQGIADGVITSTLASALGRMEQNKTKVLIAPAMHGSLHNRILIESLEYLKDLGVNFIAPKVAYGKNNLASEAVIVAETVRALSDSPLRGLPILVTGGATPVPIDNVRILTNRFTGTLGGKIAEELYFLGADVKLIKGQGSYQAPSYLPCSFITTYQEYRETVFKELKSKAYNSAIFSAAVADYQPKQVFAGKIPSGGALDSIQLVPTSKVIQEVREQFPDLSMVTFKYQENITHEDLLQIAYSRLKQGYQMVVANRGEEKGMQGEQIAHLVAKDMQSQQAVGKEAIARCIAKWLETSVTR